MSDNTLNFEQCWSNVGQSIVNMTDILIRQIILGNIWRWGLSNLGHTLAKG